MKSRSMFLVTALGVLATLPACGEEAGDDAGDPGPTFDAEACTSAVLPHRMGFRWKKLNHRISSWTFGPTIDGDGHCGADTLDVDFVGGDFSTGMGTGFDDTPILKYGYQRWSADAPRQTGTAIVSMETTLDAGEVDSGSKSFDRDRLNLEHYDRVTAVIHGYGFETGIDQGADYPDDYNPDHGYTVSGLGAGVEVTSADRETVTLDWRLRFQPGASHDRQTLNRAVPHARIGAHLTVLVIGTNAPTHRKTVDYSMAYEKPTPGQDEALAPPSKDKTRVTVDGEAGGPRGIVGFQSFDFSFDPKINCAEGDNCPAGDSCNDQTSQCKQTYGPPGYYMREITTNVQMADYDDASGRATFDVVGFASNATKLIAFYPLNVDFTGRVAWIQTPGGADPARIDREFETGEATFELDGSDKSN